MASNKTFYTGAIFLLLLVIGLAVVAQTPGQSHPVSEIGWSQPIPGFLHVGGPDISLGKLDGRNQGSLLHQRALVHGFGDDPLIINYEGDFEGGTRIDSSLVVGKGNGANYIMINDVPSAKWWISTGDYGLSFLNDVDTNGVYERRVFITKNGDVGIGTTPSGTGEKLVVAGVGRFGGSTAGSPAADGDFIQIEAFPGVTNLATLRFDQAAFRIWNPAAGDIIRITDTGRVGIGTEDPKTKFHVKGGWLKVGDYGMAANSIQLETQDGFHRIAFKNLRFFDWDFGEMVTFENGRVGIGTTDPQKLLGPEWPAALHVAGEIRGTRFYDDDPNFYADLNAGGNLGGEWKLDKIRLGDMIYVTNTVDFPTRGHITAGESLYLLAKGGPVIVGNEWGGPGSLEVRGDIDAPNNIHNACYWSAEGNWHDIGSSFGEAMTLCNTGHYLAGIKFKNGAGADRLDQWNMYCCRI